MHPCGKLSKPRMLQIKAQEYHPTGLELSTRFLTPRKPLYLDEHNDLTNQFSIQTLSGYKMIIIPTPHVYTDIHVERPLNLEYLKLMHRQPSYWIGILWDSKPPKQSIFCNA